MQLISCSVTFAGDGIPMLLKVWPELLLTSLFFVSMLLVVANANESILLQKLTKSTPSERHMSMWTDKTFVSFIIQSLSHNRLCLAADLGHSELNWEEFELKTL